MTNWKTVLPIAIALSCIATPAAAQVRVQIGDTVQDVPANTVRTVTTTNGRTRISDAPWEGEATPGMATVTTTETTEEDDSGRVLNRSTITRIVPERAVIAYVQPSAAPVSYAPPRIEPDVPELDDQVAGGPAQRVMRLRRDSWGGHFVAPVTINGRTIRAIIDTGAAYTILSAEDARTVGADRAVERVETAIGIGGYTQVGVARLQSVEIGGQRLGAMTARIGQPGIPYTLLGQTEIARLGRVTIEDGIMTITPRGVATQLAMR